MTIEVWDLASNGSHVTIAHPSSELVVAAIRRIQPRLSRAMPHPGIAEAFE